MKTERKSQRTTMANFPTDVGAEILSRLPLEHILRLRCVSKHWCALIDGHDFIKSHLKRSTETNQNLILSDGTSLYSVNMYSQPIPLRLDHPPLKNNFNKFGGIKFWGSCDGLFLLCNKAAKDDLSIWNPSTKKYQKLPITDDIDTFVTLDFYGIGYDSVHDDYKVVKIVQFYGTDSVIFHSQVKIYSLKMNSWTKTITDFPYYLGLAGSRGVFAGGALHWVASVTEDGDDDSFILAIDLATEEYRIMPMPGFDVAPLNWDLSALEGCLCLLCKYYEDVPFDVWVMKDYGDKESWTKLLSVSQRSCTEPFDFAFPVAFSKDGTEVLLLQDSKKLIRYDLKHKGVTVVHIQGLPNISHAEICVQSLVPLGMVVEGNGKKRRREENEDRRREKIGKNR